jgi:hypothetical protein
LQIPTSWTPEQAFAIFELIDDLRGAIATSSNQTPVNCSENEPDDPDF